MSLCKVAFPGSEISQAIDGIIDDERHEEGDPAIWLVLKESDARKIISAAEKGFGFEVIDILKNQRWWPELCAAVRKLRYFKP